MEPCKRARWERERPFASPPHAKKMLAFGADERESGGAFDTPGRSLVGSGDAGESGASTATPAPKRRARGLEVETVEWGGVTLTPFTAALAEASNRGGGWGGRDASGGRDADDGAREPRARPLASPPPMKVSSSPPAPPRKLALAQNMTYGYTPSRGDTRYDASQRVDLEDPETPALAGSCAMIPSALDAALGIPTIDGATLRALMSNLESSGSGGPELVCIDCRFPYEFAGGRAHGAVNLFLPHDVQRFLSARAMTSGNIVYVFYCEFSSERAPRMWRHVRNLDRRDHMSTYPALSFPHTYVLAGGFKALIAEYPECCEGGMVSMSDARFTSSCREYVAQSREVWHVAQRATSMTHVPSEQDLIHAGDRREHIRARGINFDAMGMDDD